MIHSFSCKNFYSFKDQVEVSFVVNDKEIKDKDALEDSGLYFRSPAGTLLSKVNVVIGANASGKTNVLKTISFIQWFLCDSFALKSDQQIPIEQFAFTKADSPSEFSVVFEIEDRRHRSVVYTYNFIATKERVIEESLYKNQKGKILTLQNKATTSVRDNSGTLLFRRKWSETKKRYSLSPNDFWKDDKFQILQTLKNSSIISNASRFGHFESQNIVNFWNNYTGGDISPFGRIGSIVDEFSPRRQDMFIKMLQIYNQHPALKEEVEQYIEKLGANFSLDIQTKEINKKEYIFANAVHRIRNQEYPIGIKNESSGTLEMLFMLGYILSFIKKEDFSGNEKIHHSFAFFDEFELGLHPDVAMALLDMFIRTETNQNNAQIIFTTHNHLLLNEVDKYQIIIAKKNKQGVSDVYRLDQVEGVEIGDDYFGKYIAGKYGGKPEITI